MATLRTDILDAASSIRLGGVERISASGDITISSGQQISGGRANFGTTTVAAADGDFAAGSANEYVFFDESSPTLWLANEAAFTNDTPIRRVGSTGDDAGSISLIGAASGDSIGGAVNILGGSGTGTDDGDVLIGHIGSNGGDIEIGLAGATHGSVYTRVQSNNVRLSASATVNLTTGLQINFTAPDGTFQITSASGTPNELYFLSTSDRSFYLGSQNRTALSDSGDLFILTGNTVDGDVGPISIDTGAPSGTGATAAITIGGANASAINVGTPIQGAANDGSGIVIGQAGTGATTGSALQVIALTTTERGYLTGANGMIIYNTTTAQFEGYDGGWAALSGGGGVSNLQGAYEGGNTITTDGTNGALTVSGTEQISLTSSQAAANAVRLNASAGGVDIDGSTSVNILAGSGAMSLRSNSAIASLTSGLAAANAVRLNADNAAGGIDIDAGSAGIDMDATGSSAFTVTGSAQDLTLEAAGGGAQQLILNSAGTGSNAIRLNASAGGLAIDVETGFSIDANDASSSNLTCTNTTAATNTTLTVSAVNTGATSGDAIIVIDSNSSNGSGIINFGATNADTINVGASGTLIGFYGVSAVGRRGPYTVTNHTVDRSYDANSTTLDEIADVVGSILVDLIDQGLFTGTIS